jgi:hypothetical protein
MKISSAKMNLGLCLASWYKKGLTFLLRNMPRNVQEENINLRFPCLFQPVAPIDSNPLTVAACCRRLSCHDNGRAGCCRFCTSCHAEQDSCCSLHCSLAYSSPRNMFSSTPPTTSTHFDLRLLSWDHNCCVWHTGQACSPKASKSNTDHDTRDVQKICTGLPVLRSLSIRLLWSQLHTVCCDHSSLKESPLTQGPVSCYRDSWFLLETFKWVEDNPVTNIRNFGFESSHEEKDRCHFMASCKLLVTHSSHGSCNRPCLTFDL